MWVNHHRMFTLIGRCDHRLLFYNGLLLMGITLVPFPTSLVAEFFRHDGERTAALVYNGTFIFIAICFNLSWHGCRGRSPARHEGRSRGGERDHDRIDTDRSWYVLAFSLAFWSVAASLALNLALALFFALPNER